MARVVLSMLYFEIGILLVHREKITMGVVSTKAMGCVYIIVETPKVDAFHTS